MTSPLHCRMTRARCCASCTEIWCKRGVSVTSRKPGPVEDRDNGTDSTGLSLMTTDPLGSLREPTIKARPRTGSPQTAAPRGSTRCPFCWSDLPTRTCSRGEASTASSCDRRGRNCSTMSPKKLRSASEFRTSPFCCGTRTACSSNHIPNLGVPTQHCQHKKKQLQTRRRQDQTNPLLQPPATGDPLRTLCGDFVKGLRWGVGSPSSGLCGVWVVEGSGLLKGCLGLRCVLGC